MEDDVVMCNFLVNMNVKCGDVATWNQLIRRFVQNEIHSEDLALSHEMTHSRERQNGVTMASMLLVSTKLGDLSQDDKNIGKQA